MGINNFFKFFGDGDNGIRQGSIDEGSEIIKNIGFDESFEK